MGRLRDMVARGEATLDGPAATPALSPAVSPGSLRARLLSGELTADKPIQAPQEPKVGPGETFASSWLDSIPLGKTVGAAARVAYDRAFPEGEPAKLTDKAKAEMRERNIPIPEEPGVLDDYRTQRDGVAERIAAGQKQNPVPGYAGKGLGVLTSFALPAAGVARGAGVMGRLLPAALTAAGYGGIGSVENGSADLTRGEFGPALEEAAGVTGFRQAMKSLGQGEKLRALLQLSSAGIPGGFATGLAAGGITEAVRKPLGALFKSQALRKTKDVLQGSSDIAAAGRQPLSDDAAEEVLRSKLLRANTGKTYAAIDDKAARVGDRYGAILDRLEQLGVKGPEAHDLAIRYLDRGAEIAPNLFDDSAVNVLQGARERLELVAPRKSAHGPDAPQFGPGTDDIGQLGLRQAEELKRDAARMARLDRLKNSPTEEGWEDVARITRLANEEAVANAGARAGKGSEVSRLAEDFVPTKQTLGKLLEARTAAERGAVKAAARSSGPSVIDAMIGSAAGNPAAAYVAAMASQSLRSRLPSILARGSYRMSNALQSGTAGTALARALELAAGARPERQSDTEALLEAMGRIEQR